MLSEARTCQNCKAQFMIEPADFTFYERMGVAAPHFCPQCRLQRVMTWCGASTTLYTRRCEAPNHSEKVFSVYPEATRAPLYDSSYWVSDGWDPLEYGRAYDFKKPFLAQFKELLDVVPLRNAEIVNSINSDYCMGATDSKNCYLCSGTFGSENCLYGHTAVFSKECIDAMLSTYVEQGYDLVSVDKSFEVTSSTFSDELVNCDFMYDCRGCTDCLGCVGLRNKKYCIFNTQYSKEEYKKERAKYDLGSYSGRERVRRQFEQAVLRHPRKYAVMRNAPDCTGDNVVNAKNCIHTFQTLENTENLKYCFVMGYGAKECYDTAGAGLKSQLLYNAASVVTAHNVMCSYRVRNSHDIKYSRECFDSEHLFGCIGLRKKKYCILNRQYSKEQYEELIPRIIKHFAEMPFTDSAQYTYQYGDFMPPEHSPFPYNSSWGTEYFPESVESAQRKGFWWYRAPKNETVITLRSQDIPDRVQDALPDITGAVIECAAKGRECPCMFRIIPRELEFYKKHNIALPRNCMKCRFYSQLKQFTPYRLWPRQCMCSTGHNDYRNTGVHTHGATSCPNQFETAYAPERPELLYCESCYNAEIL